MPILLTPSVQKFPASTSGPADGDLANAASVDGAFQDLLDGVNGARMVGYGHKLRPRYFVADPGPANPRLNMEPLGPIVVTSDGDWVIYDHTVTSLVDLLAANGGNPMTVKTRYYLYASVVAGVLTWVVSTTAPENRLMYFPANTDLAYVGTFLVSGVASTLVGCYEYGGLHKLAPEQGLAVLAGGAASVETAVPVSSNATFGDILPPYARVIQLYYVLFTDAGNANDHISIYGLVGASTEIYRFDSMGTAIGSGQPQQGILNIIPQDLANIYYKWNIGGGGSSANFWVNGWFDPR